MRVTLWFFLARFFLSSPFTKPLFACILNMQFKHRPLSLRGLQALESVHKPAAKFVKRLRHVPYEAALKWLRLFSLVRKRARGDLICMYKMMHHILEFPCDAAFEVPTRSGFRGHTFKVQQQRCKTRRHPHAFSVQVIPYCNKLSENIVKASSVEIFKSRLGA